MLDQTNSPLPPTAAPHPEDVPTHADETDYLDAPAAGEETWFDHEVTLGTEGNPPDSANAVGTPDAEMAQNPTAKEAIQSSEGSERTGLLPSLRGRWQQIRTMPKEAGARLFATFYTKMPEVLKKNPGKAASFAGTLGAAAVLGIQLMGNRQGVELDMSHIAQTGEPTQPPVNPEVESGSPEQAGVDPSILLAAAGGVALAVGAKKGLWAAARGVRSTMSPARRARRTTDRQRNRAITQRRFAATGSAASIHRDKDKGVRRGTTADRATDAYEPPVDMQLETARPPDPRVTRADFDRQRGSQESGVRRAARRERRRLAVAKLISLKSGVSEAFSQNTLGHEAMKWRDDVADDMLVATGISDAQALSDQIQTGLEELFSGPRSSRRALSKLYGKVEQRGGSPVVSRHTTIAPDLSNLPIPIIPHQELPDDYKSRSLYNGSKYVVDPRFIRAFRMELTDRRQQIENRLLNAGISPNQALWDGMRQGHIENHTLIEALLATTSARTKKVSARP